MLVLFSSSHTQRMINNELFDYVSEVYETSYYMIKGKKIARFLTLHQSALFVDFCLKIIT
jgi:hypothetical protein